MNELERFGATTIGRRPDRILYTADFTPDLYRRLVEHVGTENLDDCFELFRPVNIEPRPPEDWRPPDYSRYYSCETLPEGTTINEDGVAIIPAGFYHFHRYHSPLRNADCFEQIENYPLPDQSDWLTDRMAEQVRQAHAEGKVTLCWIGHMYESAWQIRGYEPFLMDMIDQPEWAQCLLDKLADGNLNRAIAAARAGVDYLKCGDDVANQRAMMFAKPLWRRMIHSRWSRVWSAALAIKPDLQIWYHSDGNIRDIIGELVEAGVTILNPVQPECLDPAEVRRNFPKLTLHGTIGTQTTMPWGTADEVRRVVRERVETCGQNGRLILGPTHILEPEVPIANIEAYIQSAREAYQT